MIDRDTLLCMSLAGRPGNFGTRFHNYLYEKLGLNYIYKAFTTQDIAAAVNGVRALGRLTGLNTDYIAVKSLIDSYQLDSSAKVMIQGSGGMGKAVIAAFRDAGFRDVIIAARHRERGLALAKQYGFQWQPRPEGIAADILVNVTPLGMAGGAESETLAFSPTMVERADVIFDVVALPPETPLIKLAQRLDKRVISGAEVIALQAVEQFALYTGVRPDAALVAEAAAFARG